MSIQAPTQTRTVWQIDSAHSTVGFKTKHMMVTTVRGQFQEVKGDILGDLDNPASATVEVEINAGSIDTRNQQRDGHLRSADFLDVENFPTITFTSTRIERVSDDRLKIFGNLSIRGVTKEVELDTSINGAGKTPFGTEIVGVTAETRINRKDFGLTWNVALETGGWLVGDKIDIELEIQLTKQS
jgi:polyisoprenoid-binding protein YceI